MNSRAAVQRGLLVGRRRRIERREMGVPGRRRAARAALGRDSARLSADQCSIALGRAAAGRAAIRRDSRRCRVSQRSRVAPRPRLVVDDQAQLADLAGRFRPAPLVDQGARHGPRSRSAAPRRRAAARAARRRCGPRQRLEHRQPAAAHQVMHQRGDEHGLAGAGQPGDAEPDRRIEQAAAKLHQGAGREPGFFDEVGEGGHGASMWSGGPGWARPRHLSTPEMQQGRWRGGVRRFLRTQRGPKSA